ncbi:EAL domain-containing protein [Methylobacter sp.]|uniref:EAL domain-containing protein n=1 Tax=Methylobacter sp. TaxID=2051955 RepID=UPI0025E38AC2|nr:EAL domain-containing protein [Methylobacter sp.]
MKVRQLKNKLLLGGIAISLLVALASMLAVSWVIRQQYLDQSNALLHKASSIINDSLVDRKDNMLVASRQLATQKNLGSTIWYLAQYAQSDIDQETLFNTYQQLVKDTYKIGRVAKLSKIAVYDSTGNLVSFALFDSGTESVGFVERSPTPVFQVATLKDGEELNRDNIRKATSVAKIGLEFGGKLPQQENVHYAVVDGLLAIESHVPIMGLAFDPTSGKQKIKQLGFVAMVQSLDQAFVDQLSHLTDVKINVFTPQGFSSGAIAIYRSPDWGGMRVSLDARPLAVTLNEIVLEGEGYYQSLIPLYTDKQLVGTIAALHAKDIVRKNTWEMIQTLGLITAANLLLIFPFAWYFAASISHPLTVLSRIFRGVASGKQSGTLSEELSVLEKEKKRDDELGDLTQSFIAMDKAVNQKIQHINEINASLEYKVKERTTKLERMNQLYAALSQCNEAIVRCNNEEELFPQICHDTVTFGGMKMTWIGLLDEQSKQLKRVASYGVGIEYLEKIQISIDENEATGQGPTGTAIRENRAFWCQDFLHDPVTAPWHECGAAFGWGASAALPLHKNGAIIGVFNLYSSEVDAFDEAARNLLVEMVMDIDYALSNFERDALRRQAESSLAASHNLLKTIIDTAPVRIFWKDKELRYLGCNPTFASDAGEVNTQSVIGKDDYQLGWNEQAELYRADDQQILDTGVPKLFYEEMKITPDGNMMWLRKSKVPLQNDVNEIIGVLGVYEDITEKKFTEERIHYLANFDSLTGLPNRTQLNDHLKYALSLAKRSNGHLALIFLDLDHFKDINDTLGHSIGDAVLIELAKRLPMILRTEDTVTRLGGDEFILLLPGVDAIGAGHVAQKLLSVIAESYQIEQYTLTLTASIGIALYPEDGTDLETLSKSADTAMYRAKQEGRQGYRFFTPEMQAHLARNLRLVNALRQALEYEQLHVYYQPQVSMQDGRIIGAEALLRWQHPELGMVSPSEFIPIAEDCGLILPIGEWVLRTAVRQAKAWLEDDFDSLIMAVNLSAVQFRHPDLPELVTRILNEEGLPPKYLELELTEGVAMHSPQDAIAVMDDLHERGIRMSIDDFGTGYSSLSYLKKFKVYKLKIDQSFVRDISTDPEDKAIVSAIINLAKSLGLKTIAEGVETAGQLAFLREQGCNEMQGYLFSKPVPIEQFEALLKQGFVVL